MVRRVEEQYAALMEGMHEFIPHDLLSMFDEREVELLIGGIAQSEFLFILVHSQSDICLQSTCMVSSM